VSNAIRYDSFLVHHLALELDRELAGKSVHAVQFDATEPRLLIDVDDIRLGWELHPTKGAISRTAALYPLPDTAILPRRARVRSVSALEDERVLRIELTGERKENATFTIVVELITNHWNAIALDHDERVLRVLKLREAGRTFRRGQKYVPPAQPAEQRPAFRSPLNEALPDDSFARMLAEAPCPAVITTTTGEQPYPHDLGQPDARRYKSLLAAFAALAGESAGEAMVRELERRVRTSEKKIDRLLSELTKAEIDEKATRERADLLLAYASTVTRGIGRVTLPSFTGGNLDIDLDPSLGPVENAQLLYNEARKHDRALKRIPGIVKETENQRDQAKALLLRARNGELTDADLKTIAEKPAVKPQQPFAERLPYRRYRTSGGLEVRVGRNARSNDELTLHHSSPRDIWLHARHVGGAHVVLRWQEADANPPHRDIMEAATLAAVHSGARTARTVPVDYTRRKYVRKPRRSPPGTVMIERAKTVFVEPDASLEERLRA
jgi:predicted ribosome quality control (RQC) complex YloA/Tae2 family protein